MYNPYNPYGYQYGLTNTNKIYVNDIDEVKSKQLPPNSDYIFLDNDKPLIYRKTVDGTGKMEVQAFKIVQYEEEKPKTPAQPQYVSKEEFEAFKREIEALKKGD